MASTHKFSSPLFFVGISNRDHIKYKGKKRPFWEFLDCQPDGYLSSLAYLPTPYGFPDTSMIGDCGAWSYKKEEMPKLGNNFVTPEWAVFQYKKYFSPGALVVAPDHMLIPFDGVDLDERRKFNFESAKAFLPLAKNAGFKPIATVHGMDLEERLKHIDKLFQLGYRHFSLGGLAARASQKKMITETVKTLTDSIRKELPDAWIHVLGLSSPDYVVQWSKIGINSFDGSSHFKQAFTAGIFFTNEGAKLTRYFAARKDRDTGELTTEITAPECGCLACSKMREEGIDTRTYGSNENNMGRAAHNLNMLMRAQQAALSEQQEIALVSCVSAKRTESSPAKDLYQSSWFIKARKYVETHNLQWYILSAKYGFVSPNEIIEPYEKTLNSLPAEERRQWSLKVFANVKSALPNGGLVRFFAGEKYRDYLIPLLEKAGYTVEVPLQGLGIGQQLSWFNLYTP